MSTEITLETAEEYLNILEEAYRRFYQKSSVHIKILERRSKAKRDEFYSQVAKDSLKYLEERSFSYSWLWGVFFKEVDIEEERRFNDKYLDSLTDLITYYDDNIFEREAEDELEGDDFNETEDDNLSNENLSNLNLSKQPFWKSKKWKLVFYVGIVLCLIIILYFLSSIITILKPKKIIEQKDPIITQCIFTPDSTKHQILVLPFKIINDYKRKKLEPGYVISRRLDSLNTADNLNIIVKFCDEITPSEIDEEYYTNIKNNHNANHIIYGFADCNNDPNKLCLNYQSDLLGFNSKITSQFTSNSYGNLKETSLTELNNGKLMENIDHLLYFNAIIAAINSKKYNLVLKYSEILLDSIKKEGDGNIFYARAIAHEKLYQPDLALIYHYLSYKDSTTMNFSLNRMSRIFLQAERYDLAKKYLEKEIYNQDMVLETTVDYLFIANSQLGLHNDNIHILNRLKRESELNKDKIDILISIAKQKLGDSLGHERLNSKIEKRIGKTKLELILKWHESLFAKIRMNRIIKGMILNDSIKNWNRDISNMDNSFLYYQRVETFYPKNNNFTKNKKHNTPLMKSVLHILDSIENSTQ